MLSQLLNLCFSAFPQFLAQVLKFCFYNYLPSSDTFHLPNSALFEDLLTKLPSQTFEAKTLINLHSIVTLVTILTSVVVTLNFSTISANLANSSQSDSKAAGSPPSNC